MHIVGEVKFIGDETYMVVNKAGTLERLPRMKWFRILELFILTLFKSMTLDEIRAFARRNKRSKWEVG